MFITECHGVIFYICHVPNEKRLLTLMLMYMRQAHERDILDIKIGLFDRLPPNSFWDCTNALQLL